MEDNPVNLLSTDQTDGVSSVNPPIPTPAKPPVPPVSDPVVPSSPPPTSNLPPITPEPPVPPDDQQIELRTGVSCPEVTLLRSGAQASRDGVDRERLPRGAELRMSEYVGGAAQTEQRVEETRVRDEHLRGLHLALA